LIIPGTRQAEIKDALSSHAMKPTVRIVFDEWVAAVEYTESVATIKSVSFVMGDILDSFWERLRELGATKLTVCVNK